MIVEVNGIKIGGGNPFVLIAGPCVIESKELIMTTASGIKEITSELHIPFIFKSSYKKANRTSDTRSEEHTSELQSLRHLVCRLLLEKKKKKNHQHPTDTHIQSIIRKRRSNTGA